MVKTMKPMNETKGKFKQNVVITYLRNHLKLVDDSKLSNNYFSNTAALNLTSLMIIKNVVELLM